MPKQRPACLVVIRDGWIVGLDAYQSGRRIVVAAWPALPMPKRRKNKRSKHKATDG